MSLDISQYYPDWVKEFKRCEPWIEAALEYSHGTHTVQDIFEDIANGNLQLWPGPSAVIVTQIVQYPRKKAIHVFLAGGDMKDIEAMEPHVIDYGKEQGCEIITLTGRPGWTRSFLDKIGYKNTQVQMYKEI